MSQAMRLIVAEQPELPDDRVVAERCLSGDRKAFALLVGQHGQAVYGFCARLVGPALAEEIAQEALARAWSRLGEFRWESSFQNWLFSIGLNLCRDHLKSGRARAEAARAAPLHVESLDPARGPEDLVSDRERLRAVERALERLPDKYREAFILKHVEGLSYQQMQEIVGMEIPALKVRVHRARAMLLKLLGETAEEGR